MSRGSNYPEGGTLASSHIIWLEQRVEELEEELECAMNLKKRLAKLQEQFDAAVKLCHQWEKKCFEARKERDKATQGVKNEVTYDFDHTRGLSTHFTNIARGYKLVAHNDGSISITPAEEKK